jgi:hypothetical protein
MRMRSPFTRFPTLALAAALILTLLGPSIASAANTTADTAIPLSVSHNSVSNTLVGTTGGAYQYYTVRYQGSNAPVNFMLSYQPGFGTGNQAFGFNLYGPSGMAFAGQVTNTTSNSAIAQYTLTNVNAMTVLIQVYNYTAGGSVDYTLTVTGLSGGSTTVLSGGSATSPGQAKPITTPNAAIGGSLHGTLAGTFNYFTLQYPGGNASMTITMNASPIYTAPGNLPYGFQVYQTLPNGQTSLVASSVVTAQSISSNSMTLSATVVQPAAATYQLQVFNYWQNVSVNYGIQVTGAAPPAPVVSGNTDASRAIVLNSARPGATATLAGANSGSFNYYLVNYPANSSFNLSVTFTNPGGAQTAALGFKVYEGANLVATVPSYNNGTGIYPAVWTYVDPSPHTFGIQVYNYQSNTAATYTIYESGSR